ncbi:Crp/Fnr family transcriptional regulator [Leisingera aquaemixtae]|jgi:CRP-like cAMP-binding protein|uniref:Crp/Fnr family transcriptional regulator n=1 Tax=Leisingera aquaemixtae TaxID=1396826 RepID=A0ABY5WM81_9RHOB|nr:MULTISPECIES: Crp/Fnr family transcriptional regulator [Leisingera]QDI76403.1 Crp/Fnr family transcriptional regulator [Leisingera aquaemixtae]UWQ25924.1 Crp/Fnr family transcriptional regulator [Leisingera aquaemixtae]UWQ38427.1 Crp/Fnr family transcriptional regulator [Leisingera aquaemixtae]UWQ42545.1 Crp/Fnr family transcriptional regulator [Leisingera aquaemixtae]
MLTTRLPDSGFLSGASGPLRRMLESQATEVRLRQGEVLFEQGDAGDALYAIAEGALEFSVLSASGRKLSLDMMRPGAVFGEITLFDPGERTATAIAAEPSRVLRLRSGDVVDQIRQHPDLAADLLRLAGQRMRWMNTQLNEQVFLPMPVRLARKLLYLAPEGRDGRVALSQAELAEFVGATREAVSKTLAAWKRSGLVGISRGGVQILDRSELAVLAEPDSI